MYEFRECKICSTLQPLSTRGGSLYCLCSNCNMATFYEKLPDLSYSKRLEKWKKESKYCKKH